MTTRSASCARESGPTVFSLAAVHGAWRACRRRKRGTRNAQRYEMKWLDHLVETAHALSGRLWRPSRAVAFVVDRPKAREILAADFSDRVVHHLLVPRLARQFEPVFIHDSFSNRQGKGTHGAVDRLQAFLRRAAASGGPRIHYLQLDIANFFNSIDRRRLFGMVLGRLERDCRRRDADPRHLPAEEVSELLWLTRVLLTGNAAAGARLRGGATSFARVPPHKRLINAPPEKGLPIGNLTSQFFANVYLNELDQFVKHTLKVRHYVRYVDDCVLLHEDPAQLARWRDEIAGFLARRLGLSLRDPGRLRPASDGIDFLGYIVRRDYRLVRRRVVNHMHEKLQCIERRGTSSGRAARGRPAQQRRGPLAGASPRGAPRHVCLAPAERDALRATLASYLGHFRHANSRRLVASLWRRYPWLADWFETGPQGQLLARFAPRGVASLRGQWRYFRRRYPGALVLMQVGNQVEVYGDDARRIAALHNAGGQRIERPGWAGAGLAWPLDRLDGLGRRLTRQAWSWVWVAEEGWLKGGLKRRLLRRLSLG